MPVYSADKIFTGNEWLHHHAVVVENNIIEEVLPVISLEKHVIEKHCSIIAPAFIDIQIYGAAGRLFAAYPQPDSLEKLYQHCLSAGTRYLLPTIATNSYQVFYQSIDAVKEYWQQGGQGVLGLHIEGPWINKLKRGAHIESYIHSPSVQEVRELLAYGEGVIRMITLAPEVCCTEVVDLILSKDIVISAGHSNATFDEGSVAFENGVRSATHLFNAMSALHHRHPGLPAAVIQHHSVMASIIPDGIHVDFEIIKIAKRLMGERLFIITDAVTETSEGLYQHHLVEEPGNTRYEANNILSGSALTMAQGVKNLVEHTEISPGEALRMASLYPARLLGISDQNGLIKSGYKADLVMLNEDLTIAG